MLIRLALPALAALAACAPPVVTAEVLPPRTSVTCAAPDASAAALGRGLLDAKATETVHGGYFADLRFVASGVDARVDGVDVRITRDGDEVSLLESVPTGDVRLVGEDDDVRKAVVENVELVPRAVAQKLAKEDAISALEFATLSVEIAPVLLSTDVTAASSTFALDVCVGCLVAEPTEEECPAGFRQNAVCRVGQDIELYACAAATGVVP